jgi:hypothetical protein
MRSRPDLAVYLDPAEPSLGDRLHAHVRLTSRSETPYDAIDVVLIGRESRYSHTTSTGKSSSRHYHRREFLRLGKTFNGGVLKPGELDLRLYIDLPHDAPPTYKSNLSNIEYELAVRVHIPWWPDRHETYVVPVRIPMRDPSPATPRVFTSQIGELRLEAPVIELSLEDQRFPLGGSIAGAVAITGLGQKKLRRVEVCACTWETALVKSTAGPTVVDRRTWKVHDGTPAEGSSIPFRLGIGTDLAPTFQSPYIRVDHAIEVVAVVAFGSDITMRVPIAVERQTSARRPSQSLPLVGKQRHVAVWQAGTEAARQAGYTIVEFDPNRPMLVLDIRGIRVTVLEENRESLGPCLVAELDWPSLGLELRLCERHWTDLGGSLPGLDKRLEKRFTIRAREASQAVHLLGPKVRDALEVFTEAALDDEGAVVLQKGGVYNVSGLERVLARIATLARALSRAIEDIPPPAALAPQAAAWRRFAGAHGARLRAGDLSLHDFNRSGMALSLDHRWESDRPVETRLWAPRPEQLDPAAIAAALTKTMERPSLIEESRVGISLPLINDPEEMLPLAEGFATRVASLAGAHEKGPYR